MCQHSFLFPVRCSPKTGVCSEVLQHLLRISKCLFRVVRLCVRQAFRGRGGGTGENPVSNPLFGRGGSCCSRNAPRRLRLTITMMFWSRVSKQKNWKHVHIRSALPFHISRVPPLCAGVMLTEKIPPWRLIFPVWPPTTTAFVAGKSRTNNRRHQPVIL